MQYTEWGRSINPDKITKITTMILPIFAPAIVYVFFRATYNENNNGNFTNTFVMVCFWIIFQAILSFLPDKITNIIPVYKGGYRTGQPTPGGHILEYNINGFQSWLITHVLYIALSYLEIIDPAFVAKNWKNIFISANIIGFFLSIFAYIKAKILPTHESDVKFTGIFYYDFIMGAEFNPRIFGLDLKLFFNGRPGIIGWTLINLSFAFYQYEKFGSVSNSMILVNILQAIYVLDFFWNEEWYLKTIDIAHDHFGWILAFGDCVWLPFTYTLQATYLSNNYIEHSYFSFHFILILGIIGYIIFRITNYQKNIFRKAIEKGDEITFFGRKTKYIKCAYITKDGKEHKSWLLFSGLWGISRHMNYTGDLILSLCYCLAAGFQSIVPYFYIVYMFILLVTRCWRDETRCEKKYGEKWKEYCSEVPYRFIPYIY